MTLNPNKLKLIKDFRILLFKYMFYSVDSFKNYVVSIL
jgi:hypothetical protein